MPRHKEITEATPARETALRLRGRGHDALTPSQLKVLRLIMAGVTSIRDIGEATGITSPNGVFCIVRGLRKLGLVTLAPAGARRARTMRPTYRFIKAGDL
jgi:DNA-binding CsgD family transcriptional regulator